MANTTLKAAESAPCKVSADVCVFRSADMTREDTEELVQRGYISSGQTEDGCNVFILEGDLNASIEESIVFVEGEDVSYEQDVVITRGHTDIPLADWAPFGFGTPDGKFFVPEIKKQSRNGPDSSQPGAKQQVVAELTFLHACDRSDNPRNVTFFLKIVDVHIGVIGSINTDDHRGHFVSEIKVTAEPKWDWGPLISSTKVYPADDSIRHAFDLQESTARGIHGVLGARPSVTIVSELTTGTVTKDIMKLGWRPSKRDWKTKAVTWTWEVTHWDNNKPFDDFDRRKNLGDFLATSLPKLPFRDTENVNLNCDDTLLLASWTVPVEKLVGLDEIEWDISVNFSTKVFKLGYFGKVNAKDFGKVDAKGSCKALDVGVRGYETLRAKIKQSLKSE